MLKHFRSINDDEVKSVAAKEFEELRDHAFELADLVLRIPNSGVGKIPFKRISAQATKARRLASQCVQCIHTAEAETRKSDTSTIPSRKSRSLESYNEKFRNEKHYLHQISSNLGSLITLAESDAALAANNPRVLLSGIAGSGKTHFLCDLAKHRIERGLPTFVFLGEEIDSKDPLDSVKAFLNVSTSHKGFLAELNRYAAAKHTRAIIVVDAVNESLARPLWQRFAQVSRYKNLGIVLSIRSGFEQGDLPTPILANYVRVEHQGFAEHEWEAVTRFFTEYKVPLPEVPLLFPEFRIPLFLRIFCESFAGAKQPIKGHYGFTHIFEQYVKRQGVALLKRMGETADLGRSRAKIWDGTIKELALHMGENGTDRVPEQQAELIAAKQFPSRAKVALGFLEKAWLITKVPRYKDSKVVGFDYRFPYQKFSDHLIVRNLLQKHLNPLAPRESFRRGSKLHDILSAQWGNRGLIEALAIQVPERLRGRELIYITPRSFRRQEIAKETFLESLVWRDLSLKNGKPKYIKAQPVFSYLNKYIAPYYGGDEKILETILSVCAIPDHPLNARLLHRFLGKKRMPERDSFWLPYINGRYNEDDAISRLITWAWDGGDKTHISSESLELAGMTLVWLLASSNRFLRDRATKALVSLLVGRLQLVSNLLDAFKDIDDPYIAERLYAAAYGCALCTGNDGSHLSNLAHSVYDRIFAARKAPAHFLLRDYARGLIELALTQAPKLATEIDVERIRPPYGSSLPSRIPTLRSLRRKYNPKRKSYAHKQRDYWQIWSSLMYNNEGGLGDFGNYIVNSTLNHWCNLKLGADGSRPKTAKELAAEFEMKLSSAEKDIWRDIEGKRRSLSMRKMFSSLPFREEVQKKPEATVVQDISKLERLNQRLESTFIKSLKTSLQQLYRDGVLSCRTNPKGSADLDNAAIQRLIFKRIVELGWTPELFGKYDLGLRETGRDARKIERIGKKYQWIAFHEMLGRIADNYVYRGSWGDSFPAFEGPWQMGERNIDPSCLLRRTPINPDSGSPWWCRSKYTGWKPSVTHTRWTQIRNDLPDQRRLLESKSRGGWLVLEGYFRWEQPPSPGQEKFEKIRRDVWYITRSYVVKQQDGDAVISWAKEQDFMGRWMPDPLGLRGIFLKEIPGSLAYRTEYEKHERGPWVSLDDKQRKNTGFSVLPTTEEYIWEGSGFDCSVDDGITLRIPAREIVRLMELTQSGGAGNFRDKNGEIVAMDPSAQENGPPVLLVKKKAFMEFLKKNAYELLWTVMGEKLLIGGDSSDFLGRLEMGGAFRMKQDGKLEGSTYTKVLPPRPS